MRIFKYWIKETKELNIDGFTQISHSYGGSNLSIEDAKNDAKRRLEFAQDIINGTAEKVPYEVDILEEIIYEIDKDNIVTRNRYGALVLNSKNLVFIDVDDYRPQFSLINYILGKKKNKKEIILSRIEKTINKLITNGLGFRVYETFNGYRIIVTGKIFDARSEESKKLMNVFHADPLYKKLCIKQNCYRARLTPKPYRMKIKSHKIVYPNRNEIQEAEHKNWVEKYECDSSKFSSCYLINTYGLQGENRAIDYHDKITNVRQKKSLA